MSVIKSVQRGVASFSSTTTTVPISQVNSSKSILKLLGASTSYGGSQDWALSMPYIGNLTSISFTIEKQTAEDTTFVSWEVLEYV